MAMFIRTSGVLSTGTDYAKGEKKRRGDPGLDAEQIVLAVEIQWKRAQFGEMLGHQAHDRLIGIEVRLLPERPDGASKQHERHHRRSGQQQRVPFDHAELYSRAQKTCSYQLSAVGCQR
jgi:hypothetical protein